MPERLKLYGPENPYHDSQSLRCHHSQPQLLAANPWIPDPDHWLVHPERGNYGAGQKSALTSTYFARHQTRCQHAGSFCSHQIRNHEDNL